MKLNSLVWENQKPLYASYEANPNLAKITDVAWVNSDDLKDPFHTEVILNEEIQHTLPVGLHRAVGGLHDLPNPGDIMAASLAACFESTLRMIANRFGVKITKTRIKAIAHLDVKGTLLVDRNTPVGFTSMDLLIRITSIDGAPEILEKVIKGAEHCCVIFQTLNKSLEINTEYKIIT